MKTDLGLFNSIVLQRNADNVCDAEFGGKCRSAGIVKARVAGGKRAIPGLDGIQVGRASGGKFSGRITGLAAGGPYTVTLRIEDTTGKALEKFVVSDVFVGDVWVLGGQSNMQGNGLLSEAEAPHPMVRAFYMNDRWDIARDPIHDIWQAVDQVHTDMSGGERPERPIKTSNTRGTGLGVAFGKEMFERTGVPQGLIACAHGGTSMAQWDPKLKLQGGRSLYGAMLRRFSKNGGKIAGILWYQGCGDATTELARLYSPRMKMLVRSMRRDFGDTELPFVAVQIARVYGCREIAPGWLAIQEQQRLLPSIIEHCTVVSAIDLPYADSGHVSGEGQNRLGRRLARAMCSLRNPNAPAELPIAPRKITIRGDWHTGTADVLVEFDNVVGNLQSAGRPAGLDIIHDGSGNNVYRIDLQGNRAVLRTNLFIADVRESSLHYAYGMAPYCNITDAADRSIPAFGPMRIGKHRALTPFVQNVRLSSLQPSAGKLKTLAYPSKVSFKTRLFPSKFCGIHAMLRAAGTEDPVVYFACTLDCTEKMRLAARLGYDGPIKMWVDGERKFHDPRGTNPAWPDQSVVPFSVGAGTHEVLVALGANHGKAWGIFLRFERRDVPQSMLKQGPDHYRMPEIRT